MGQHSFPDVNRIAQAGASIARTRRANELQAGEVQAQGQRNKLRGFKINQAQATEDLGAATRGFKDRIAAGDVAAFVDLARENPDEARRINEAMASRRKLEVDAFERGALMIGRVATAATQIASQPGTTPEQVQNDYRRMVDSAMRRNPDLKPDDFPEKFTPTFAKQAIAFGASIAQLQKAQGFAQGRQVATVGVEGQPGAKQRGIVEPGTGKFNKFGPALTPAPGKGKGGGAGGDDGEVFQLSSSDSNAIGRAANSVYGELFDPETGAILILDQEKQIKALRLRARAEKIFQRARQADQPMSHGEAVAQAAEELGITKADFKGGTTVRDQRSPTGRSVDRTGTAPQRGRGKQTREQQLKAFEDFTNELR